ncbi:hypothetical protein ANO11243_065290 [Dothideomycetidae sp. 11243]|nr:hypothetical protein ANO11243_065290 [fungal sp. No.11243]
MITAVAVVEHGKINLAKDFDPARKDHTLPIVLEYLAEGAANVVLRLVPFGAASKLGVAPPELLHKLLRLRKDKRSQASIAVQHAHLTEAIAPLIPAEHLVQHILVTIDAALLNAVNHELEQLHTDGFRPSTRAADRVATTEPQALLVTDMSAIGVQIALEFKPKWLAPSPNAPDDAKRCRTCALRAQRVAAGTLDAVRAAKTAFCPLALVGYGDEGARLRTAEAILAANECEWFLEGAAGQLAAALEKHVAPLLARLEGLQRRLDPNGIMAVDTASGELPPPDLLLAMTLRDCAVFLRVEKSFRDNQVEVRLADLDAKLANPDKVAKWRGTEEMLLRDGWYENEERDAVKEQVCVLSRASGLE